jgi:hypothetical protein
MGPILGSLVHWSAAMAEIEVLGPEQQHQLKHALLLTAVQLTKARELCSEANISLQDENVIAIANVLATNYLAAVMAK